MTDQDPPIGPLRRLDPAEPDEQDVGRLKRLDPEADEDAAAPPADAPRPAPSRTPARVREGVSTAIALAALLSLSSIAAIGGLVAVSMRTIVPAGRQAVAPIEPGAPVTTIRVGESAQGPREQKEEPRPELPQEPHQVVVAAPAPVPAEPAKQGGRDERADADTGRSGSRPKGLGAWCDAREGGSCDAVAGGAVLQPAEEPDDEEEGDGESGDPEGDKPEPPGHAKR